MGRLCLLRSWVFTVVVLALLLAPKVSAVQHIYVFAIDTTGSIRNLLPSLKVAGYGYLDTIPVDGSSQVWILTFETGLNAERFQRVLSQPSDSQDAKVFLEKVVVHGLKSSHVFRSLDEVLDLVDRAAPQAVDADVVIHLFSDGRDTGGTKYTFEQNVDRFNALRERLNSQMELCCHSLDVNLPAKMQNLIDKNVMNGMSAIKGIQIPPRPQFSVRVVGNSLTFINQTTGQADQWNWDFGDGTSSQEKDPTHVYGKPGQYEVSLTAVNSSIVEPGGRRSVKQTVAVRVPCKAKFEIVDPDGFKEVCVPVQFRDSSVGQIKAWSWNFGDNKGTSTAQHPQYTYTVPGTYQVTLKLTCDDGQDEGAQYVLSVTVGAVGFSVFPVMPKCGQTAKFTNESQGQLQGWKWDFGDGGTTAGNSPEHIYAKPGAYTVTLTAIDKNGKSHRVSKNLTVGGDAPRAQFKLPLEKVGVGQSFTIIDQSTGTIDTWQWDMGDGTVYTSKDVTHAYKKSGTFTIVLTVSGPLGKDSAKVAITVLPPPPPEPLQLEFSILPEQAKRNEAVVIINQSVGTFSGWRWDFGDGSTFDQRDPGTHVYRRPGAYTIRLIANGSDKQAHQLEKKIAVVDIPPKAAFTVQGEILEGSSVTLKDESTGTIDKRIWKVFEEGATQELATYDANSADHKFVNAGKYTITLAVSNDSNQSDTCSRQITVIGDQPVVLRFALAVDCKARGRALYTIRIADQSTGSIKRYAWDFGDGGTSNDGNPQHTYDKEGTYQIRLTLVDHKGREYASTEGQVITITVLAPRRWWWYACRMIPFMWIGLALVAFCGLHLGWRNFSYLLDGVPTGHGGLRDKRFDEDGSGFDVRLMRRFLTLSKWYALSHSRGDVQAKDSNSGSMGDGARLEDGYEVTMNGRRIYLESLRDGKWTGLFAWLYILAVAVAIWLLVCHYIP